MLPELQFDPFADMVFATGSIVEGFHNLFSDLDILVIGDTRPLNRRSPSFFFKGFSRWVDVSWLSKPEADAIASKLTSAERIGWHFPPLLSLQEFDIAHRIKLAIPITNLAAEHHHELRNEFRGSSFCYSLCHSYIRAARARWYDAIGAFQSNQRWQALHVMKICRSLTMDGMLALFGETNPSEKWRWAKFNRVADAVGNAGIDFDPDLREDDLELTMRETAALMFNVTSLYHGLEIDRLPPPALFTSRYERTPNGVYIVYANGSQDLVSYEEPQCIRS